MSTYIDLGLRSVAGTADQTGHNPGNLTCSFAVAALGFNVPYVQAYHIAITSCPPGGSANILLDNNQWGFTAPGFGGTGGTGGGSEIEYETGMLLNPGSEIDFLWSVVTGTTPVPTVSIWFRYDLDIPANKVTADPQAPPELIYRTF